MLRRRIAGWSIVAGLTLPVGAVAHGLAEAAGLTSGGAPLEHALLALGGTLAIGASILALRRGGAPLRAALPHGTPLVVFIALAQAVAGIGSLVAEGGSVDPARLAFGLAIALVAALCGAVAFALIERRVVGFLTGFALARAERLFVALRAGARVRSSSAYRRVRAGRGPPRPLVFA